MAIDALSSIQMVADKNNAPRYCAIEVTKLCNFRCKHCYIPQSYRRKIGRVPLDIYKRFFSELKQIGGFSVCFTGGEPLLFVKDLFEMIGMVRNEGMIPILYTNASLITREIAKNIRQKRVLEVAVTLYGSCARTMDNFTGHLGSFEKAIQGIKFLLEEDNHVRVRWPVTRENVEEFTDFYNLIRNLGAEPTHYTCFDLCLDSSNDPYKLQMEENDFIRYIDILSTLDVFQEYLSQFKEKREFEKHYLCSAGRGYIYLGSDGLVYPCTHITKPLGNILTTPLSKIWDNENPVLKEVRAATLDKMKCIDCEYVTECGICIAESYLENGSFLKPSEHSCQMAKLSHRIQNYVIDNYLNK